MPMIQNGDREMTDCDRIDSEMGLRGMKSAR